MTDRETVGRPPYGIAALVAGVMLALYVVTIAPTTQFWDTSEYIAAAKVLGIPHPPGSPLFVLVAHVWGMIPFTAHYALRINLFAAVTSALASGLLFLVAERFLRPFIETRAARLAAAFAGIVVGATTFTVWNQSVVNAKVYTLSLLSLVLVLWLTVRWGDAGEGARRDRLMLLIGYLLVLGSTNHMMAILVAPAVVGYVLMTDWREAFRPWIVILGVTAGLAVFGKWAVLVDDPLASGIPVAALLLGVIGYALWRDAREFTRPLVYLAVAAVVIGISLNYVFLPIRAALFPPINEGEPATWQALWQVLSREQYQKPPVTQRMADLPSQLLNYIQYFSWQFGHDWAPRIRNVFAALFAGLGLLGAAQQWRRDRRAALAMTALMLTLTVVLVYYLNFRYGYSIRPGENLDREVRERDYFFVASFLLWGVWVALGLGSLFGWLQGVLRQRLSARAAWYAAAPVLFIAVIPLAGNRLTASRAGETLARDFAVDLLQSLEPYAIIITAGDNDLFPLWYAQEVEGVRKDVVIANQSLMNTDWHIRQLLRREVFPFDIENAAPPYRDFTGLPPDGPLLDLTIAGVDSLPVVYDITQGGVFRAESLEVVIEPGRYSRSEIITLQLIAQNLGQRPIYFARTTGATADRLGLTAYLRAEGFVRRVTLAPIETSDNVMAIQGIGWLDLKRTEQLLFDVYHPEAAARARPRGWVDRPSQNILSLYYVTYGSYGELIRQLGDSVDAERQRLGRLADDLARRMLASLDFRQ